jgi:hypothetical protein
MILESSDLMIECDPCVCVSLKLSNPYDVPSSLEILRIRSVHKFCCESNEECANRVASGIGKKGLRESYEPSEG